MTLTLLVNTILKKKSWLSGVTTKLKQANKQAANLTVCNRCNAMQCNAMLLAIRWIFAVVRHRDVLHWRSGPSRAA